MKNAWLMVVVIGTTVLGTALYAQQAGAPDAAAKAPAKSGSSAGGPAYRAVATVQDLMGEMIDPASKVVFNAVSSQTTATGTVETAPKDDAEWANVRRNALMMVEGANLLLVPGRHFARPENARKANEGELPPAEIEIRVNKDRASWNKLVVSFREAAMGALKAADGKKKEDFGAVSETIDAACESCHLRFWYPDQEQLLKNAPKPK